MYKACIAVVDASRARVFTFERVSLHDGLEEKMVEAIDLVNPARRRRASELFTTSGRTFGYDDHRDEHIEGFDRTFAAAVIAELTRVVADDGVDRVILCASPRMLGVLRTLTAGLYKQGRIVDELPRNIVELTPTQLRDYLGSYGLLPPHMAPAARAVMGR
jgi:protein required for attachment to host cells